MMMMMMMVVTFMALNRIRTASALVNTRAVITAAVVAGIDTTTGARSAHTGALGS